jgi:hypothetical protein
VCVYHSLSPRRLEAPPHQQKVEPTTGAGEHFCHLAVAGRGRRMKVQGAGADFTAEQGRARLAMGP